MARVRLAIFVLAFFVAGCASIKTFHMPRVEEKLALAYKNSEEISAQMQVDLTQKKSLIESLRTGKSPSFAEIEAELKKKLKVMDDTFADAQNSRKAMTEAKAEVAALAYNRKKIGGDQPEYSRVEDAVTQFEAATERFNKAAADYTRESNSLADLVTSKRLFFNFDVAEFQIRAEKTLATAQENIAVMERELTRTQNIYNSYIQRDDSTDEVAGPLAQLFEQMKADHGEYLDKTKQLEALKREMTTLAGGQSKIPSTASNWSDVQRVVTDYDRGALSLNEIYKGFQARVDKVRSPRGSKPNP